MMTIGLFAERARLSPKALRLYGELGLLVPASIDPATGYRLYRDDQVGRARTIALLRRIVMPLADIADVLDASPDVAVKLLGHYWAQVEADTAERRMVLAYLQSHLRGENMTSYDIQTRHMSARRVLSINRHLRAGQTDAFFNDAFARLRAAGPGRDGIDGAPYLIFYGDVSEDSDGPLELCRPIRDEVDLDTARLGADVQVRDEPAHDEAYVRLAQSQMGWPAILPVRDALEAWATSHDRKPAGPLRQVLIADQRTATADTFVCDLTVPLS